MKNFLFSLILVISTSTLFSQTFSQWRGADRTGIYGETGLLKEWPENGPELLWKTDSLGKAYSSVAVTSDVIYATGMFDTLDILTALDKSGKKLWTTNYGFSWENSYPDTRGTPTIENGKIYVASGMAEVSCIDAKSGKTIWKIDAKELFGASASRFGFAESLLLIDDKVIFTPGGDKTTVVALDKETGKTIWQSESVKEKCAYISPVLITHNNRGIIVTATAKLIIGVDPKTGELLWKYNYSQHKSKKGRGSTNCTNSALYRNGEIFITSGYNHSSILLKLADDAASVTKQWVDTILDCHHGGVVEIDGYIYGANWQNNKAGKWVCLEWETGKAMYEEKWNNKGPIISADGMLYCYAEKVGELALVKADPEEFAVISSFKLPKGEGQHWSHPVINDGKLYVRHSDRLFVYKIK